MNTPQLQSANENNVIHFLPLRDPDFIFQKTLESLISQGVRADIAKSLASYSAFQGQEFDSKSPVLIHIHEEIGQEPAVKGTLAA